jgi:hypothetical protein
MDEPAPSLRASDADRERVAFALQTAVSEGRLTLEEFDERVASVYAARTYGDLAAVTSDLPASPAGLGRAEPGEAMRARPPAFRQTPPRPAVGRGAWRAYLSVNLICFVIWALVAVTSGGEQDFWFLWVAGPWGAVLLGREISGRGR